MKYNGLLAWHNGSWEEIGNAVGIDSRTVKNWISVLEASGIIMILQPYASNLAKRIIKTPGIYFLDTGLCSFFYYRDRDQKEVDLIYVKDQTLYPIDIKKVSEKIRQKRISKFWVCEKISVKTE